MDKPQILVATILLVAVGFFALRFTSEDSDPYAASYDGGDDRYAMAAGDGSHGDSARGGRFGDRFTGDRGSDSRGGPRVSRFGPSGGGPAGAGGSRAGGVETASGGVRDRGGRIGSGVGGSRGGGGGTGVAGSGRSAGGTLSALAERGRSSLGADGRDARVDMLTGKENEVDPFYDDNQLDDDPTDDVLLEVNSKEDVDRKAEVLEDVEAADDGEWLEVGEDAMLTFPDLGNANPDAGTISLDIIPNWNGSDQTDNSLLQIREPHKWENRMQLVKNGQFLRFIVTDNTGHEADISYRIPDWVQGDAHRVQATWEDGVTTLYVDGKRVGSNTYPGDLEFKPNTPMHLGSDLASGGSYGGANAKIGNFSVLGVAKGPDGV